MGFGRKSSTALVCCLVMFIFADQNLLAPNLSKIAKEFNFSDEERDWKLGGQIAIGFFVLGAPAALLIGYLADSYHRCRLLGLVVACGESACLATYFTHTYNQLLLCRVITGISVGGAIPVIFSILGDYYGCERRILVASLIGIATTLGISGGQLFSGLVSPVTSWRFPYLVISIPAITIALSIFLFAMEPKRGSQEEGVRRVSTIMIQPPPTITMKYYQADIEDQPTQIKHEFLRHQEMLSVSNNPNVGDASTTSSLSAETDVVDYDEKISWEKVKNLLQTKSALIIFLQGLPGCVPWGVIYVFLNDYLASDRNMSSQAAATTIFLFGIGGLVGQYVGGSIGRRLYAVDKRLQCVFMGLTTLLAVVPFLFLLNATVRSDDIDIFLLVSFLGGAIVSMNGPNVRAVLQNVCSPETRGTAFAIFVLTDDLGKGFGPALVVQLLNYFDGDRRMTYNIAAMFWWICGALLLMLVFTVRYDEEQVQQRVMESLQTKRYHDNQESMKQPSAPPLEHTTSSAVSPYSRAVSQQDYQKPLLRVSEPAHTVQ